jgi:hypothetical protein
MRKRLIALATLFFVQADIAAAQQPGKLFIEGDMVRGDTREGATGPVCVLASQFKRMEKVVFRVRVRNAAGELLDGTHIKSVVVELMNGQKFQARYGGHPPANLLPSLGLTAPSDYYWAAAWQIPQNFPNTLSYKVIAVDMQGNTQEWAPFNHPSSLLTVIPGDVEFIKAQSPARSG